MEKENGHMISTEPDGLVLLKYIKNIASEEEKEWIESWLLVNRDNEKILSQIASIYYASETHRRIVSRDTLGAYNKVSAKIRKNNRKIQLNRVYAAVACFVGVLLFSTMFSYLWKQVEVSKPQFMTIQANAGMRGYFNLPDGTIVHLNSGSTLSYPLSFDNKKRKVTLSGEAYFDVFHDPEHPFIVSVSNDKMQVKVFGTEFNLQAYEKEDIIQTTLVTGCVSLEIKDGNEYVCKKYLEPSEKALYNLKTKTVEVKKADVESEIAWKDGYLIFKDIPLPQLLKRLSNFYNVEFKVIDPVINSYRFTGTFKNRQLSQVLDYLKISSQIDYSIKQMEADDSESMQREVVILRKMK